LGEVVRIEHDESDGGSEDDDDFEVTTIISKHTGHLCSSFAAVADTVSFGDGVEDAKTGPSRLTPSSPRT
jgi:hypothetical protein